MFDTMSITKAVIGLLFHKYHTGELTDVVYIHKRSGTTVQLNDALDMRSGIHSPDFNEYYDVHRTAKDVTEMCRTVLDESDADVDSPHTYNDFMYQLLPNAFRWNGNGLDVALEHFMGNTDGWKWKKDKKIGGGVCFAPNGLEMSIDAANKFARKAQEYISRCVLPEVCRDRRYRVPDTVILDPLKSTKLIHYWHGWWMSDTFTTAFAYGWKVQVIGIGLRGRSDIMVHLESDAQYDDDSFPSMTPQIINAFRRFKPSRTALTFFLFTV